MKQHRHTTSSLPQLATLRRASTKRSGWASRGGIAVVAAAILFAFAGCHHDQVNTEGPKSESAPTSNTVLRFGYQKQGTPNLLRLRGDLDKRLAQQGVKVQWLSFPAGPQMFEALAAGSLDLTYTGGAPVLFAQASGANLVYAANTPADATGLDRGILIPKDSTLQSVRDIVGKRIAVQKGSETQNFLIQVLAKYGLDYSQIKPVYLAPGDARPAFESGSIDGWAIWDPFLTIAQKATGGRILANNKGLLSAGSFYTSTPDFVRQHSNILKITFEELAKTADWTTAHPHDAAVLLGPDLKVDPAILEEIYRRPQPPVSIRAVSGDIITAQQQVADNFQRLKILPKHVDVRANLLTPEQYAALIPAPRNAGVVAGAAKP